MGERRWSGRGASRGHGEAILRPNSGGGGSEEGAPR
jgi:hypothetical protein